MEEDVEIPKEGINKAAKEEIDNELANFLKPKSEQKPIANIETVGSALAKASEPMHLPIDDSLKKLEMQQAAGLTATKKPIIRTYKSDMQETIESGHLSSINIAVSQSNRMAKDMQTGVEEEKKFKINKNILIISIVLIIGGSIAVAVPYFLVHKDSEVVPVQNNLTGSALIAADIEEKINVQDLNLDRVTTTLEERVQQSNTKLGQIKDIYLTQGSSVNEKNITAQQFLTLIKAHVPDNITRTLKSDYMFGMHNFNGNQKFLILKVGDYASTFSGMLSWENNLWQDFKVLFALQNDSTVNDSASSTDAGTINPFVIEIKKFQDATFSNKDVREVKDSSGNIIFLYSIVDDTTVVITTSTDTLKEIVARINATKVAQQ